MGRTKKDTNIESTGGTVETSRNTTKEKRCMMDYMKWQ